MSARRKIHIGDVIRNAVAFNPNNWHGMPMNSDALMQSSTRLFTLLHQRQIDYLLVGGIAMLQYVEGRNTEDIDLIMALAALEKLPEIKIATQDTYFARGQFEQLKIDILLTQNPLFEHVRQHHATRHDFHEHNIPCATVDGLLLLKLYALPSLYRQGNFARVGLYENDVATLIQVYSPDLEQLFAELSRHLNSSDLAAVRKIVAEIEQRIERFRRGLD